MHFSIYPKLRPACALALCLGLLIPEIPLEARTRKGDKFLTEARKAETKQDWDQALSQSEQALAEDPADPAYQLQSRRVRFEASSFRIARGQRIRSQGKLAEALEDFERAYQIDPSSDIAEQEIRRTRQMIDREKKKATDPKADNDPELRGLTPVQTAKKEQEDRISSMESVPELKPLNQQPITLRMNNQKAKVLFDTVGKIAGLNVLFDPDFEQAAGGARSLSVDLNATTISDALDYISVMTKSFWKPLSENTIFVTQDNQNKRREYEDQVVRVFYLSNVTSPQELQEIITTLRQVIEVNKLYTYNSQNAVVVRAEPARMAIVEKVIADLDKPKAEVVIDVMVMEVNSSHTRNLAAAFAPNGISSTISFTPRTSLQTATGSLDNNGSGTGTDTGTGTGTGSNNNNNTPLSIPLGNLKKIDGRDYSITNVPGGLIEAIMSDIGTRILQSPQLRAVDNFKTSLKIGDKVPTATGSFQPGVGGVGVNALVNTQFTFIDTGVNLEITPRVHDNREVSLHVDIDISQVKQRIDLGGISQPVIGQRKATLDVRVRDGEVNMLGGLMQIQDNSTVSGVPGLSSIPFLRRLFTSEDIEKNRSELLITLVPHIVRGPELNANNLRAIYSGNANAPQVRYSARLVATPEQETPQASTLPAPVVGTPANPSATPPLTQPPGLINPEPTAKPEATAGATARVVFAPSQLEAQAGSSFTVALRAEGATDLQSIESQLKFDPKIVRVSAIAAGDLLQQNGLQLVPQKNILNDSGDASATLSRDPSKGSVSGSGALFIVTFQAVGKGQTAISPARAVFHNSTGATSTASGAPLIVTVK